MNDVAVSRDSLHRRPRQRQARSVAHTDASATRLTERDTWILDALTRMRFLTTMLLALLFFGRSRAAANKRLRRLLDAGLVRAWVRSLSEDNVYSLTRRGHAALGTAAERASASVPRLLDGNLDHLLAINAVRIGFAVGLPAIGGELAAWRSDWEIGRSRHQRIAPDALFCVRWDGGPEHTLSLEVDRHKRSPRGFLRKMLAYASIRQQGVSLHPVDDLTAVLAVGTDARWVERYRSAAAHVGLSVPTWFATLEDVERNAAGDIWRPTCEDEPYSLRRLCFLPYGKEGLRDETAGMSERCARRPARLWPYGKRRGVLQTT